MARRAGAAAERGRDRACKVHATALNRGELVVGGAVHGGPEKLGGNEAAGEITAVGAGVTQFQGRRQGVRARARRLRRIRGGAGAPDFASAEMPELRAGRGDPGVVPDRLRNALSALRQAEGRRVAADHRRVGRRGRGLHPDREDARRENDRHFGLGGRNSKS